MNSIFASTPKHSPSTISDSSWICKHSKAQPLHDLGLQLVAQIGCLVIEEFHFHSVGKAILKVDIFADQRVQLVNLGHAFDAEGVDLGDELFFERFELTIRR